MRILIRSGKPPHVPVSPEASLARWGWGIFGANSGNTLFLESVYRAVNVPDAEVVVDSLYVEQTSTPKELAAEINERFDMYVIPLANAFRAEFTGSLKKLTSVIRELTIPVVVVGVGGQSSIGSEMGGADQVTRDFVSAVLDRSASIGVRGTRTEEYLRKLGFKRRNIDVIGCPSLYNHSGDLRIEKADPRITEDSPISINITPSANIDEIVARHVERYPNLTYVPQEHHELAMLLWGTEANLKRPQLPMNTRHQLYLQDRIRFFLDPQRWREFMRTQAFAFGSRIHGTIGALAAGTPAVLLAHDSRTLELADYHRIPKVLLDGDPVEATRLYEEADFEPLNKFMPEAMKRYIAFLNRNDVPNIHQPGNQNPQYEAELVGAPFPPGIRSHATEMSVVERELLRKLNWLRQGNKVDAARWVGGYMPEWKPRVLR